MRRIQSASRIFLILLCGSFGNPSAETFADRRQSVKGIPVSLVPPKGFTPAENFPGFELPHDEAFILVAMVSLPFQESAQGITTANMAERNMILEEKREVPIAGANGLLLHAVQVEPGKLMSKWIAMFGNDTFTVLIVGTFPFDQEGELGLMLQKAVLTAEWMPPSESGAADPSTSR